MESIIDAGIALIGSVLFLAVVSKAGQAERHGNMMSVATYAGVAAVIVATTVLFI